MVLNLSNSRQSSHLGSVLVSYIGSRCGLIEDASVCFTSDSMTTIDMAKYIYSYTCCLFTILVFIPYDML